MATGTPATVGKSFRLSKVNKGKILLILKAGIVVGAFVLLRWLIVALDWDFITFNSLVGSFIGGVFFTIGIILAGVVADYKEAEKIPIELAVLIKALRNDTRFIGTQYKDKASLNHVIEHIQELLITVNTNFRSNHWHKKNVDAISEKINDDIIDLGNRGVATGFLTKLRDNLTNIDRLSHRIDSIMETNFIPAAYMIAELATAAVIAVLLFTHGVWGAGGWLVVVVIVFVMVSVFLLIRDIDNPFEYDKNSCADVDLSVLFKLEEYSKEHWKEESNAAEQKPETNPPVN